MKNGRRHFLTLATASLTFTPTNLTAEPTPMFGLIGKMIAKPEKRDELISILIDGVSGMPGCLSYIIAKDPTDSNAIWITEVWQFEAQHKASLSLPEVRAAIAKGKPLIASFAEYHTTAPVGGHSQALR